MDPFDAVDPFWDMSSSSSFALLSSCRTLNLKISIRQALKDPGIAETMYRYVTDNTVMDLIINKFPIYYSVTFSFDIYRLVSGQLDPYLFLEVTT